MTRLTIRRSQIWKDNAREWADVAMEKKSRVVSEATREVFELATSVQPSVKVSGTYEEGFVPVDTGALIESQRVTVNGQTVATGIGSADAVPERITQRTNVSLWFGADYARFVEYGTAFMGGRFFIRNAKQQWIRLVDAAALRYKS